MTQNATTTAEKSVFSFSEIKLDSPKIPLPSVGGESFTSRNYSTTAPKITIKIDTTKLAAATKRLKTG